MKSIHKIFTFLVDYCFLHNQTMFGVKFPKTEKN